jgi:hypothetical protein
MAAVDESPWSFLELTNGILRERVGHGSDVGREERNPALYLGRQQGDLEFGELGSLVEINYGAALLPISRGNARVTRRHVQPSSPAGGWMCDDRAPALS